LLFHFLLHCEKPFFFAAGLNQKKQKGRGL
jgi:hypothetical protein